MKKKNPSIYVSIQSYNVHVLINHVQQTWNYDNLIIAAKEKQIYNF